MNVDSEFVILTNSLKKAAEELPENVRVAESIQRQKVIDAIARYRMGSFELAEALVGYRDVFKRQGSWTKAAAAIAREIDMSPSSLYRMLNVYERCQKLPVAVRTAMKDAGVDPMRVKNEKLTEAVLDLIPDDRELLSGEAAELVQRAIAQRKSFVDPRSARKKLNEQDRQIWEVRSALKRALKKVPTENYLECLRLALGQVMFELFARTKPFTLKITPEMGPFTLDGQLRELPLQDAETESAPDDRQSSAQVGSEQLEAEFALYLAEIGQEVA